MDACEHCSRHHRNCPCLAGIQQQNLKNLALIREILSAENYGFMQYFMLLSIVFVSPILKKLFLGNTLGCYEEVFHREKRFHFKQPIIRRSSH